MRDWLRLITHHGSRIADYASPCRRAVIAGWSRCAADRRSAPSPVGSRSPPGGRSITGRGRSRDYRDSPGRGGGTGESGVAPARPPPRRGDGSPQDPAPARLLLSARAWSLPAPRAPGPGWPWPDAVPECPCAPRSHARCCSGFRPDLLTPVPRGPPRDSGSSLPPVLSFLSLPRSPGSNRTSLSYFRRKSTLAALPRGTVGRRAVLPQGHDRHAFDFKVYLISL